MFSVWDCFAFSVPIRFRRRDNVVNDPSFRHGRVASITYYSYSAALTCLALVGLLTRKLSPSYHTFTMAATPSSSTSKSTDTNEKPKTTSATTTLAAPRDHPAPFQICAALTPEILEKYDGFVLDQFGVLHNGSTALEGAPDCVQALADQGKKCIILSNSSALAAATMAKLPRLGFCPDHFQGAVTSGEEAALDVASRFANSSTPTGTTSTTTRAEKNGGGSGTKGKSKKVLFWTWAHGSKAPSPADFLQQCGDVIVTDTVEEADLILLHGCQVQWSASTTTTTNAATASTVAPPQLSLGDYMLAEDWSVLDPLLQACSAAGLPMVCANPDYISVQPDGTSQNMPGKIADRYADLYGGKVTSFGKPQLEHFEACVRALGLPKQKVVHIGDSLHHDIAGANAAGIDSVFVAGGVHLQELACELNEVPTKEDLQTLFALHGETPTYVVPMLRLEE